MKRRTILIIFCVMALLAMVILASSCNRIKGAWNVLVNKTETVCKDTAVAHPITVYDVIAARRSEIESKKIDSIYLSIPDPILIRILDQIGVNVDYEDVVKTYLNNQKYYDGIEKGIKDIKHLMPDTLPKTAPIDMPKVMP